MIQTQILYYRVLLVLILSLVASRYHAQSNVVYGERDYYNNKKNTTRVFLDKNGDFYPNETILDDSLLAYEGSLKKYYLNKPSVFIDHSLSLKLVFEKFNDNNFIEFQNKIIENIVQQVNSNTNDKTTLYTFIHGYKKPKIPMNGSNSAKQDYEYQASLINEQNQEISTNYFLEVYWDGTYACCFGTNIKQNNFVYNLFEYDAQQHAVNTGYALRKLITKIDATKISFFSHSLGAKVLTCLLFNCYQKDIDQALLKIPTPHQKIKAYFVAAAISSKPFKNYYQRNSKVVNHYEIFILHNKKDFALRKRFLLMGPGPKKRGFTSLGCNYRKESDKLCQNMGKNFYSIDLRKTGNNHHITNYLNTEIMHSLLTR